MSIYQKNKYVNNPTENDPENSFRLLKSETIILSNAYNKINSVQYFVSLLATSFYFYIISISFLLNTINRIQKPIRQIQIKNNFSAKYGYKTILRDSER